MSSPLDAISALFSRRLWGCFWWSRYGADSGFRGPGRADDPGAVAGAASHRRDTKVEGAIVAPPGPSHSATLSRPRPAAAQGGGSGRQRLLAIPRRALSHLRRNLGGRGTRADFRHRPPVQLDG